MRDHSKIVRDVGKPEDVAAITGSSPVTVRSWARRNSIPSEHWKTFSEQGWASLEELAEAAAQDERERAA